jgi:hypothetical protein
MNKLLASTFALITLLLLSGCLGLGVHVGGGKKNTTDYYSKNYGVTLGQQLMDLQKAYDQGVITKSQYDSEKKKLLKEY